MDSHGLPRTAWALSHGRPGDPPLPSPFWNTREEHKTRTLQETPSDSLRLPQTPSDSVDFFKSGDTETPRIFEGSEGCALALGTIENKEQADCIGVCRTWQWQSRWQSVSPENKLQGTLSTVQQARCTETATPCAPSELLGKATEMWCLTCWHFIWAQLAECT